MCLYVNFNIIVHVSHFMVMIIEIFFWKLIKYLFFFAVKKRFKICDKDVEVKKAENKNEGGGRNYFARHLSYGIKFYKKRRRKFKLYVILKG